MGYVHPGEFDESSATLTLSDLIAGNYTVKVQCWVNSPQKRNCEL